MSNEKYDQPLVSIDVVPIRFDKNTNTVQVSLGKRQNDPFKGEFALPGVLLVGERVEDAAYRALESKVGIHAPDVLELVQLGVFDTTSRDPRGPTLSIAFAAVMPHVPVGVIGAEATFARVWRDASEVAVDGALPFDHDLIVARALEVLGVRLWTDVKLTRDLLGVQFSTRNAVSLTELLRGEGTVDRTNFNRGLKGNASLVQTGKIAEGVGRSSSLWQFRD